MYIRGKYLWYGDDLTDAFEIRRKVFVEEQGMDEKLAFDESDKVSCHAIVYDEEEKPVASGRISFDGTNYKIGRISVLKEARGKKLGDFIVRMLVDKGYLGGAKTIKVNSQLHAIKFYEKIGFIQCGNQFKDIDGLVVQPMELKKGALCKECQKKNCSDCNSK